MYSNPWHRVRIGGKKSGVPILFVHIPRKTGTPFPALGLHFERVGADYVDLGAMTVGDQLLWGAAEPLRRTLNILREAANPRA